MQPFGTTIFAEMSALAVATGSINLGQGFPDTDGPDDRQARRDRRDQRRRTTSIRPASAFPSFAARSPRTSSASTASTFDADTEVLVTAGATEAIAAALLALCEPGDEVVTFEPYYDSYAACIAMAGRNATRRHAATARLRVRSRRAAGRDHAAHEAAAAQLAAQPDRQGVHARRARRSSPQLAQEHDLLVVTDEVYEHLVFDGEHVPIATLPGMRDRTVTISSGGKTFSFTGWKVGWVCARAELVDRGEDGQAVPHLRERRPIPVRDRRRTRAARRLLHRPRATTCATSATACAPGSPTRASTCSGRTAPTSSTVDIRPLRRDRRARVLPVAAASAAASSPCRTSCSTTTPTRAGRSCASRAASDPTCSTKRAPA